MPPAHASTHTLLLRSSTSTSSIYVKDSKNALSVALGVIFGVIALVIIIGGISCCIGRSKRKSSSRDQLFGDGVDFTSSVSALKGKNGIHHSNNTDQGYCGGQLEEVGHRDDLLVLCCGSLGGLKTARQRENGRYTGDMRGLPTPSRGRGRSPRSRDRTPGNGSRNGHNPGGPDRSPNNGPNSLKDRHSGPSGSNNEGGGGGSGQENNCGNHNEHRNYYNTAHIMNVLPDDRSGRTTQRRTHTPRRHPDSQSRDRRRPHGRSFSVGAESRGRGGQRRKRSDRWGYDSGNLLRVPSPARTTQRTRSPPEAFTPHMRRRARSFSPGMDRLRVPSLDRRGRGKCTKKPSLPLGLDSNPAISHLPQRPRENGHERGYGGGEEGGQDFNNSSNSDSRGSAAIPGYENPPDLSSSSSLSSSSKSPFHPPVDFAHTQTRAHPSEDERSSVAIAGSSTSPEGESTDRAVYREKDVDNVSCTEEEISRRNSGHEDGSADTPTVNIVNSNSGWRPADSRIKLEHPGSLVDFNPSWPSTSETKATCNTDRSTARSSGERSNLSSTTQTSVRSEGARDSNRRIHHDPVTISGFSDHKNPTGLPIPSSPHPDMIRIQVNSKETWNSNRRISGDSTIGSSSSVHTSSTDPALPSSRSDTLRIHIGINETRGPSRSTFSNPTGVYTRKNSGDSSTGTGQARDPRRSISNHDLKCSAVTGSSSAAETSGEASGLRHSADTVVYPLLPSEIIDSHSGVSLWVRDWSSSSVDEESGLSEDYNSSTSYDVVSVSPSVSSVGYLSPPASLENVTTQAFPNISPFRRALESWILSPPPPSAHLAQAENFIIPASPQPPPPSLASDYEEIIHGLSPTPSQSALAVSRPVARIPTAPSSSSPYSYQTIRESSLVPSDSASASHSCPRRFVTAPSSICSDEDADLLVTTFAPLGSLAPSWGQRGLGRYYSVPQITVTGEPDQQLTGRQNGVGEGDEDGCRGQWLEGREEGVAAPVSVVSSTKRYHTTVESVVDDSDVTGGVDVL